jgi:hypothetical protein
MDLIEQELLDVDDAKEVSQAPRYMIRNVGNPNLYWSDDGGWSDYAGADTYLFADQEVKELPQDGQWVGLEETCLVKVEAEKNLREALPGDFCEQAELALGVKGFLAEHEWHPAGHVRGRARFAGPTLLIRSVMGPAESAQVQLGEHVERSAEVVAKELDSAVLGLVPLNERSSVHAWHQRPRWDRWNAQWVFETILAAADHAFLESLGENALVEGVLAVPPEFAKPEGLSEDGQRAWQVIASVLREENAFHVGTHQRVMFSPDEWKKRGEEGPLGAELMVIHEDGDHAPFFNLNYHGHLLHAKMDLALRRAGFYAESQTNWYSAIYKLRLEEAQLEKIIEPDDEDEWIDRADVADQRDAVFSFASDVERILKAAGLEITQSPDLQTRSNAPLIFRTEVVGLSRNAGTKARVLGYDTCDQLKQQLGLKVGASFSSGLNTHTGRWRLQFYIPPDNFTEVLEHEDEDDDAKDVFEPETREGRIRQLFTTVGLHVDSMIEEPADPGWGDLGQPQRFIGTVLQPDASKPWTSAGVATNDLYDFARRIKSNLGEILETTDIDFTTTFNQELGAWKINWFIGEPGVTQRRVIENEEEEDEQEDEQEDIDIMKDVADGAVQFQIGDIVRKPGSHWPDMIGRISHSINFGAEPTWWIEWWQRPQLNGYASSRELEFVDRPEPESPVIEHLLEQAEDDDDAADAEIVKDVGLTPPDRTTMPSGLEGWQEHLQNVYANFEEFQAYDEMYGLAQRFGFETAEAAWETNPIIRGSVTPSDSGVVEHLLPDESLDEARKVRIVLTAMRHRKTGKIGVGAHHTEAMEHLISQGVFPGLESMEELQMMADEDLDRHNAIWDECDFGFVTSDDRFVSKAEANRISGKKDLHGEDLPEALSANDPFPVDEIEALAHKWVRKNGRNLMGEDARWELAFTFYLDPQGKLRTTELNRGEAAEVEMPPVPEGCDEVGSLHTHVGSIGEFSDFDLEEGQKRADQLGHAYYMFVIGPNDDEDGLMMSQELFEPGGVMESEVADPKEISQAAAQVEEPTDAQKEAGNYKKGHLTINGLDISLENPKGSERSGKDADGKEWKVTLPAHYGYIKGTKGKDKDHIDVYIGPDTESEKVFVVNQNKKEGGFDEHKVMLCFADEDSAVSTYDKAYSDGLGKQLRGSVIATDLEQFKTWLKDGNNQVPFESGENKAQEHVGRPPELRIMEDGRRLVFKLGRLVEGEGEDDDDTDGTDNIEFREIERPDDWRITHQEPGRWHIHSKAADVLLIVMKDEGYNYNFRLAVPGSLFSTSNGQYQSDEEALQAAIEWAVQNPRYIQRTGGKIESLSVAPVIKALNENMHGEVSFVSVLGSDEVVPALEKAMREAFPSEAKWVVEYSRGLMDPALSVVAMQGADVLGFYILGRRSVMEGTEGMELTEDLTPYESKTGVEGVALGVVPSARGRGIGNQLKDYPKNLGADYIWGLQMKSLRNLDHWLKRRRLVAQSSGLYATLQDLK